MLRNLYYLILDDEKSPGLEHSTTSTGRRRSTLLTSSTLEDLGQHLLRADEPELEL